MAGRHAGWTRVRGGEEHPELVTVGRQLLGQLVEQRKLSGVKTQELTRRMPDGSVVRARWVGDQPTIEIQAVPEEGGGVEEVIHLYISSPGGLRIYDLGTKKLAKTITGLDPYEVDAVSSRGTVVHMTGSGLLVRVDVPALVALGTAYTVDTTVSSPATGRAIISGALASPDGTRLLVGFHGTTDTSSGTILDDLGGLLLTVTDSTMAVVRPAIRMTFRPVAPTWEPGSERFFLPVSRADDPGDTASGTVATSTYEGIAAFSREGVLQGTTHVYTWAVTPDSGFNRLLRSVAASNRRLYAIRVNEPITEPAGTKLLVFGIENGALPTLLGSVDVAGLGHSISLSHGGTRVAVHFPATNEVAEYDVSSDTPALLHRTASFATDAHFNGGVNEWRPRTLQNGPKSRVDGRPPDTRRFIHLRSGTTSSIVRGYRNFDKPPAYELDMTLQTPHKRYALAVVGSRDTLPGSRQGAA